MDGSETTNSEIIFETWLYKLRGSIGEKRVSHYLSGAWSKKYFVLLREGDKPKIFYYNKKPRDYFGCQKGVILLDQHYHVDQKPASRGKDFLCQLTTATRTVLLAVEKEEIYDLLMFFLRTQIRLKDDFEVECFVVRPERSEDHRRIGAQSAMCLLHVSHWGLTLALQLSKSVLAQWPLRCIRWYECTGRGRFTIETGSHASTGAGRYVFKTRVGQDSAIYDRTDALVNEQSKLQGMALARVSSASGSLEAYLLSYSGLDTLTEVMADVRFVSYLKKIARDIYDHLREHLGGGGASGMMDSYNSTGSTMELLLERNSDQKSLSVRSHLPNVAQSRGIDISQQNLALNRSANNTVMTSQYLHMGSPVFDMSPLNEQVPSLNRSLRESVSSGAKVDYSLEQFVMAPDDSGSAEVSHLRRPGGSSYKHADRSISRTRLRLRSLSLDDLSEYVGASERAVSYTNSVFHESGDSEAKASSGQRSDDDSYPYSYATTPDFGFLKSTDKKLEPAEENDGYCQPKSGLSVKTLSDPNLCEDNGIYRRTTSRPDKGNRIKSIRHVVIGQNINPRNSSPRQSKDDTVLCPDFIQGVIRSPTASGVGVSEGASQLPSHDFATTERKQLSASVKGVGVTPKTRVFVKQKSLGNQSPSASRMATSPTPSVSTPASAGPPLMLFHVLPQRLDRSQRQLPDPPSNDSARAQLTLPQSKEATSFV